MPGFTPDFPAGSPNPSRADLNLSGPEPFRKVRTKSRRVQGGIMNKKLLAGLAAVGLMASGGSATATALAAGAPAAAASTAAVAYSTSKAPECGPLGSLVTKGTITRAQAIAIHNALVTYVRDHWRSTLDTVLGQEVKNHTITKAQASAVASAVTQWVHKYQSKEPSHHALCHHGHGGK
jgi:hypothetical protein